MREKEITSDTLHIHGRNIYSHARGQRQVISNLDCTSLVTQLVMNPPAMQETRVRSLGWEGPLEKGTATYSSILAWRIPWTV